jgi:hypothetical protein
MTGMNRQRPPVGVLVLVLILPIAACGQWPTPTVDARGGVTVFNRTTSALTVTDTVQTFIVAGCGDADASNFRINSWTITGLGLHTYRTGRGSFGPHTWIMVTVGSAPVQSDTRPSNLPPCQNAAPGRL